MILPPATAAAAANTTSAATSAGVTRIGPERAAKSHTTTAANATTSPSDFDRTIHIGAVIAA